jgi:hypothetical protein
MTAVEREKLGEWLSAYADGELNAEQNAIIERLLVEDEEVRHRLDELRAVSRMVFDLPRHGAPPSILQDIRRQTERDALLGDAEDDRASVPGQSRYGMRLLATAALLAVVVTGGLWMYGVLPGRPLPPGSSVAHNTSKSEEALDGLRESESPESSLSDGSAAPGAVVADARFGKQADLATLEQRISRRAPSEELVNHPFANEMNVVTLTYATDRDRDGSLAVLTDRLRAASVEELAIDPSKPDAPQGGVFIKGRAGVNFVGPQDRQVLVRLPKNQVESLVREIDSQADVDARMQVGPIAAHGRDQVHQLAAAISRGDFSVPSEDPARPAIGGEAEALGDLLVALNIDKHADWLAPGGAPDTGDTGLAPPREAGERDSRNETATPERNGVSLPGGTLEKQSSDGASAEDSLDAKSKRSARGRERGGRSTATAEAPTEQALPPSPESAASGARDDARPEAASETAATDDEHEIKDESPAKEPTVLPVLPDRPSLAARRLAEVRQQVMTREPTAPIDASDADASDAGASDANASDANASDANASASGAFVTLVIQLVSREPARPAPPPADLKLPAAQGTPNHKPLDKVKAN